MKERVLEILVFIMSEIQADKKISEIDLGNLTDRGYTQAEISAAFSWLYENLQLNKGAVSTEAIRPRGSFRLLHDAEKMALSTEAQGLLVQLRQLGLLDDRDMENVIERAMMAGYEKLSVEEVRTLIASVLFSKPGDDGGVGRSMLNDRDTIH